MQRLPTHSRSTKNGIYRKASPIEALMVRQSMQADVVNLGLHCMMTDHQTAQPELLARLAYLLGMGAEIARAIPVAGNNRPGLHQALATVVGMAVDGHRWDASWGAQLSLAADISIDLFCSYSNLARRFEPGARLLSHDVMAGTVRADVIKPLEFSAESMEA
ncbi:hypothetical protein HS961_20305 [Comamonas piscis]|uniref:Uncharacterized protein n=1 Tax=Comamonas piscis TaxID=1562974 RepID=A0A7G5ELW7_9BURK|nr:hypothetical protein [Comamonas piscis]QMV74992.1 hypothetical protein HS961_20305 [Comamonas piscis]WSO33472.1 hypothetical protein VUJ63_20370 [Comamonas piscis]